MGDTVQEIDQAVQSIAGIMPILGGVISALVPGGATVATLAGPILSIADEILQAIESLKTAGLSHSTSVAIIGQAVTSIGQNITAAAPAAATQAAAPIAIPHESH